MLYILGNNQQEQLQKLSAHFYNDNQISSAIILSVHFRPRTTIENGFEKDPLNPL